MSLGLKYEDIFEAIHSLKCMIKGGIPNYTNVVIKKSVENNIIGVISIDLSSHWSFADCSSNTDKFIFRIFKNGLIENAGIEGWVIFDYKRWVSSADVIKIIKLWFFRIDSKDRQTNRCAIYKDELMQKILHQHFITTHIAESTDVPYLHKRSYHDYTGPQYQA